MKSSEPSVHVEPHIKESNYIRDVVFGFGDGVNTSLGIIAGVGGAIIAADIVILAALIGMFTGAKAMAVQNYLSCEIPETDIGVGNKAREVRNREYSRKGETGN